MEVKPSTNREMIKESNDQKLASANTTFSLKLVVENDDLTANAFSQTTMIHKCALLKIKKISENRDLQIRGREPWRTTTSTRFGRELHCTLDSPETLALLFLLKEVKPSPDGKMIKLQTSTTTVFSLKLVVD